MTQSGDSVTLWCGEPGCRNHVHLGPEARMAPIPAGWTYTERRGGWVPLCPQHDYGHPRAHKKERPDVA